VTLVDWGLAARTAGAMLALPRGRAENPAFTAATIEAAAADGIAAAAGYARLGTPANPPRGELIDRDAWARNALATLREATAPVEERLVTQIDAPGPLGPLVRRAAGAGLGLEVGVAAGYAAGRVLGQLDVSLFGVARPARLLFVGTNLERARQALDADPEVFLLWVALHEGAHVVQFGCVPWLADHLRALARELMDAAGADLESGSLARRVGDMLRSPRETVRAVLRGELTRLLADPEGRERLDRLQATMSVVEGHAEHVMDAAAGELGDDLTELRRRLDARRGERGGLADLIGRLLGIDAKLRQYELGKSFCDAIAAAGGPSALAALWESPERLPSLAELEQPERWLERSHTALQSGV
jgi:coenzyme F420 biosynthesis associated uncharacterized protein